MFNKIRYAIASYISPDLQNEVEARARAIAPRIILKDYAVQFTDRKERPEDGLTTQEQKEFAMWAYTLTISPWFKILTDHIINTQANWVLRNATTERHADFGRAVINAVELVVGGVDRLSGLHDDFTAKKKPAEFDEHSTGISE